MQNVLMFSLVANTFVYKTVGDLLKGFKQALVAK